MALIPGWGTLAGYIAGWIDKVIPSKRAALVDELNALNKKYQEYLAKGKDTEASLCRKRMEELRKKASFTDGEL